MKARPSHEIPIAELKRRRVWEFTLDEGPGEDESWTIPVDELPVSDLCNAIVATDITLANGDVLTGVLGCVSLQDPLRTAEFISLSVEKDGKWFHLARYFDPWYSLMGPDKLAEFLGLSVDEVFPVAYDISDVALGVEAVVRGTISAEPRVRLTKEERRALQFPKRAAETD